MRCGPPQGTVSSPTHVRARQQALGAAPPLDAAVFLLCVWSLGCHGGPAPKRMSHHGSRYRFAYCAPLLGTACRLPAACHRLRSASQLFAAILVVTVRPEARCSPGLWGTVVIAHCVLASMVAFVVQSEADFLMTGTIPGMRQANSIHLLRQGRRSTACSVMLGVLIAVYTQTAPWSPRQSADMTSDDQCNSL